MKFFSINFLYKFVVSYFYKNLKLEDNLDQLFKIYKPDLVIYPTHSMEPEVLKIQKLSDNYKCKTFHIIDNWDNLISSTYYEFKPDFIGVWGKQTKIQAIKIHNFKKKMFF